MTSIALARLATLVTDVMSDSRVTSNLVRTERRVTLSISRSATTPAHAQWALKAETVSMRLITAPQTPARTTRLVRTKTLRGGMCVIAPKATET